MFAVSVDIEDWYHIPSVCGSPFSVYKDTNEFFNKWDKRYNYLSKPTKRILDLFDDLDVTATFFVVADVIEHYPGLLESIIERGHNIGCHGMYHSCKIHPKTKKPLMRRELFEERTLEAKQMLEEVYGKKITGYRAPNGYVGGWMLDSLEKIGFKYDSSVSVNSMYNKTDSSLKGVSSYPYHPKKGGLNDGGDREFVEIPFSYFDIGIRIPTSGGPALRFFGSYMILKGLEQSLRRGDAIFYFHPLDISHEKFPRIGRGRPLYWLIKGKAIEKRIKYILNHLEDKVEFSTLEEVMANYGF